MNILVTKLVDIDEYRDLKKSGVVVFYYCPDLKEVFPISKDYEINVIVLKQSDHALFFEKEGRGLKIPSVLSRKLIDEVDTVNIVVSSHEYFDRVYNFFEEFFNENPRMASENHFIYEIDAIEERYELEDKTLYVQNHLVQIRGPIKKPKDQKPKRISDE